jgi:hypothetical protein
MAGTRSRGGSPVLPRTRWALLTAPLLLLSSCLEEQRYAI